MSYWLCDCPIEGHSCSCSFPSRWTTNPLLSMISPSHLNPQRDNQSRVFVFVPILWCRAPSLLVSTLLHPLYNPNSLFSIGKIMVSVCPKHSYHVLQRAASSQSASMHLTPSISTFLEDVSGVGFSTMVLCSVYVLHRTILLLVIGY